MSLKTAGQTQRQELFTFSQQLHFFLFVEIFLTTARAKSKIKQVKIRAPPHYREEKWQSAS